MSAGEDIEKREPFSVLGGTANWCSHYGNSIEVPQKIAWQIGRVRFVVAVKVR